jgi:hypothetical protein
MLKSLLFIILLFTLFSCGTTSDEKLKEVVLDAEIALGSSNCKYAIDVLESYGRVNSSAIYLKTLASAYACRGGYSTPTFFSSDLTITATPAPLGGMTLYSTSKVTTTTPLQTDSNFEDLQTAINILLYAGGISTTKEPTYNERAKHFSGTDLSDINSQLLYLEFVQLGKYMRYYGNGSNTAGAIGYKGSGTWTNNCFTSYDNSPLKNVVGALPVTFTCRSSNSSHPELQGTISGAGGVTPVSTRKTRLCQGVVLLNGIFELLPSVIGSATGGSLNAASGLTAAISQAKSDLILLDSGLANVLSTINQTQCEDDTFVTIPNIESYFFGMMESIFL